MKKNKMMRLASLLLVLVLMTSSVVGGTFAKYTTKVEGSDSARVAKWGFTQSTITLDNLFAKTYDRTEVAGADGYSVLSSATSSEDYTDVIAPGTSGYAEFGFAFDEGKDGIKAPEVDYTFVVSTNGSECGAAIKANENIIWKLDDNPAPATDKAEAGTWDALIAAIEALDGNVSKDYYDAGTLPSGFNKVGDNKHKVSWEWTFSTTEDHDKNVDTVMGNADDLDKVKLVITVTATQVD